MHLQTERIAWEPWSALDKEFWIDQMWTRMLEPLKPVWEKVTWLNTHFVSDTIVIGCWNIEHCGFHCLEDSDQSFPLAHPVETGMLATTSHQTSFRWLSIAYFQSLDYKWKWGDLVLQSFGGYWCKLISWDFLPNLLCSQRTIWEKDNNKRSLSLLTSLSEIT